MRVAPFEYLTASSLSEASDLLYECGDNAKVIAGGQSLVPMMTLRLASPSHLIDLVGAAEPTITIGAEDVTIGALTRHCDLERSSLLKERCPILTEAAHWIGNGRVRSRGTIGGSLAHADPSAELACVVLVLEANILTIGQNGQRSIRAQDFFQTYFTTALEPHEIVVSIEVPIMRENTGWSFLEIARRTGDFAIAEVAALIELEADGRFCRRARIVAGSVAERPVELSEVSAVLEGADPDLVLTDVEAAAVAEVDPTASAHAPAEYKAWMTGVLARRCVSQALRRARGIRV